MQVRETVREAEERMEDERQAFGQRFFLRALKAALATVVFILVFAKFAGIESTSNWLGIGMGLTFGAAWVYDWAVFRLTHKDPRPTR